MLYRYSEFWQCLPINDECAKPTPLYMEFCQTFKIMVAERKRVDRLVGLQHTRMCPSPVLPQREGTRSTHRTIPQKGITLMRSYVVCQNHLAM